jgi:ketosteroid isomerase-like protein
VDGVDLVYRWFDAWNNGDVEAFADLFATDAEVIPDPGWMDDGPVAGKPAIRAWYEGLLASWEDRNSVALRELFRADGDVVSRFAWVLRSKHNGIEVAFDVTVVNGIADGKIVRQEYYFDHAEALRAMGLSE